MTYSIQEHSSLPDFTQQVIERPVKDSCESRIYNLVARGIFATRENLQTFFANTPAIQRVKERMAQSQTDPPFTDGCEIPTSVINAKNDPNEEGELAMQNTPPISLEDIHDKSLSKKLFVAKVLNQSHIILREEGGICRGICDWFIYLYLNTKPNPNHISPASHVMAVAAEFEKGGGAESVVLQQLLTIGGKILGLKVGKLVAEKAHWPTPEVIIKNIENLDFTLNINAGVYKVDLYRHRCVFIKISKELSFFFDPNKGLYKIIDLDQESALIFLLQKTLKLIIGDKDKKNPEAKVVSFYPVIGRSDSIWPRLIKQKELIKKRPYYMQPISLVGLGQTVISLALRVNWISFSRNYFKMIT